MNDTVMAQFNPDLKTKNIKMVHILEQKLTRTFLLNYCKEKIA